jgi:hypothetical protein
VPKGSIIQVIKLVKVGCHLRIELCLPLPLCTNNVEIICLRNTKQRGLAEQLAMGNAGREMYKYVVRPNSKDSINTLKRRDKSTIFKICTQHIQLNSHLNRIQPQQAPVCHLCTHPRKTVDHLLFEWPALDSIRERFLPSRPDIWNITQTHKSLYIWLYGIEPKGRGPQAAVSITNQPLVCGLII